MSKANGFSVELNKSLKCFIETVEDRSEKTLIPLVQKWILPGTIITSDCWKGYINLEKYGYVHKTVNHSKEFVDEDGDNTNKIEGHWRVKANLSTHGRRKNHYSTYFAEFMWRYIHKEEDPFLGIPKCEANLQTIKCVIYKVLLQLKYSMK